MSRKTDAAAPGQALADVWRPLKEWGDWFNEEPPKRTVVSLATLPSWPNGPPTGHGWGETLNGMLNGGLWPGHVLAVGAARAGAGKTAWVHQLADGLALRTVELIEQGKEGPLTPVLFMSEMRPDALAWRSLARWTGRSANDFRAGKSHPERESVLNAGREALEGMLGRAHAFIRHWQGKARGPELVDSIAAMVGLWTEQLRAEHPGREVWPVVVMDPVQRFISTDRTAVSALVGDMTMQARRDRWIAILTSDSDDVGAPDGTPMDAIDECTAALPDKLMEAANTVLYLRREGEDTEVTAHLVKNRNGPLPMRGTRFNFNGAAMRFEPVRTL